eukprot:gene4783-5570_t
MKPNFFSDLLALLFPRLCGACATPLYKGEQEICLICLQDLPYTDFHLYKDHPLAKQFWGRVSLNGVFALLYYKKSGSTKNLVHQLKYKDQCRLGIILGEKIGERLLLSSEFKNIDLVLPVPLHWKKAFQRGYNQSTFIAMGIASVLKIPLCEKAIHRKTPTRSQTRKDRYQRFSNLTEVFKAPRPELLSGKHLLLVDDVITTGATVESCALELFKCGPLSISVAAIAFVPT